MRGKSWAIDPPAPSVMRSGLLWCQFPGTMTCHVHGRQKARRRYSPRATGAGGHQLLLLQGLTLCVPKSLLCQAGRLETNSARRSKAFSAQIRPIAGLPLDSSRSPSKSSSGALCSQTQQNCLVSHLLWGKDTAPSQAPSSFYTPIFFTSPSALPPPGLRTCRLTSGMGRPSSFTST